VTTHVVRLKLFRLKVDRLKVDRLKAVSFNLNAYSLQPTAYPPDQLLVFTLFGAEDGRKKRD